MRATPLLLTLLGALTAFPGCVPDKRKEPEWRKPPKEWDPQGDNLTFGKKGLESFNDMSLEQRAAHVEQLKQAAGTFRGQAIFRDGAELGDGMDDIQLGRYEVVAEIPDPVLYEITVAYRLYSAPELMDKLPPHAWLEFTGTLADLVYQDESKPRRLDLKVKVDNVTVLSNAPGA